MHLRRTHRRHPGPLLAALAAVLAVLGLLAPASAARAEVELTLFAGNAEIRDSDLRLTRPDGTDLRFEDVSWDDASFESPPYYGARLTWWRPRSPAWGVGLDFTHVKANLDVDEVVPVHGRRDGAAVDGRAPVSGDLDAFAMSHGLNTVVLQALRRWGDTGDDWSRVTWFAALGAGASVPHVEARIGGLETADYQLAGPALQAVLGLDTAVDEHVGITLEARLSWLDLDTDLTGGAGVETELWLLHLAAGLSLRD
jgi:lipid A oxidase